MCARVVMLSIYIEQWKYGKERNSNAPLIHSYTVILSFPLQKVELQRLFLSRFLKKSGITRIEYKIELYASE